MPTILSRQAAPPARKAHRSQRADRLWSWTLLVACLLAAGHRPPVSLPARTLEPAARYEAQLQQAQSARGAQRREQLLEAAFIRACLPLRQARLIDARYPALASGVQRESRQLFRPPACEGVEHAPTE